MTFRWERRSVAIDFRLTASQREIQLRSREFAKEVLSPAIEAESLPIPEERFAATKPAYEAMIAAGFLRKCIPFSAGGESASLTDTAIMVEELYAVNASVALTLIGTVLGLLPLLIGGTEQQRSRLLPPFLKRAGAPLAAFCATEPGGSANVASPPPGEGVRTTARFSGDRWIIQGRKSWVSSATGWDRKGADLLSVLCRTDPDAPAERGISIIFVEGPASGLVFERAIDSVGHRAHLLPQFALEGVSVPGDNVLGSLGGGLALTGSREFAKEVLSPAIEAESLPIPVMHDRPLRSAVRLRKRVFKPVPMGGGLGQAQAALAPKNAGQFLNQMLLGQPLRGVLGDERRHQVAIFGRVLPRQHGVARQDAMAQRVEAGDLGAAELGRQRGLGLVHFQKLPLPLRLLVRASSSAR